MPRPRFFAVSLLLVLSVVLAACGADDSADPTPEPTATRSPILPTELPGTTEVAEASPTATEGATATTTSALVATPAVATPASGIQPVEAVTPTILTVTEATPSVAASTTVPASPVAASPVPENVSTPVAVTLVLDGTEQVDYVITEEGCIGLGQWRSLKAGAQLVVRDANGTVVDVATLEAGDDGCSWLADINAPGSEFVSISIPMVTEVWLTQADIETGEVEITVP